MKSLYRSNATIDTNPLTNNSLHNCPSCRCKSTDLSLKLNHSISQGQLANPHHEHNLYLSNQLSEVASERTTGKAYQSSIFHQPSKITFKYAPASPKQTNISFSYTSPPKNRKHHSSEARFNTKRFKNAHFPHISQQENDCVPLKKIVKNVKEKSPYYEVYTGENTPEKHRVLKMKKEKSKQKLEITLSKKSSSHQSIEQQESPLYHNDYEIEGPRNTPINALWINPSQKTQHSIKNEEIQRFINRENAPASIQLIQQTNTSRKEIWQSTSTPNSQQQLFPSAHITQASHRKYPTVESLNTYEARIYVENISEQIRTNYSAEETSLRFMRESSQKNSSLVSEEVQLARSISEELQLHYDYYYQGEESDRSISIHVAL